MTQAGIATTWPALRARPGAQDGALFNQILYDLSYLREWDDAGVASGPSLWSAAGILTEGAVLQALTEAGTLLPMVLGRIGAIAASRDLLMEQDSALNLAALALADLAAAGLGPAPHAEPEIFVTRMLRREPLSEQFALRTAWAAIGHGETKGVPTILPFDPARNYGTEEADGAFSTNEEAIYSALYRCVSEAKSAERAYPAWRAWVEAFPVKLAQEWSSWPELLWSARAVHVVIGGEPEETLLDWLRSEIP